MRKPDVSYTHIYLYIIASGQSIYGGYDEMSVGNKNKHVENNHLDWRPQLSLILSNTHKITVVSRLLPPKNVCLAR